MERSSSPDYNVDYDLLSSPSFSSTDSDSVLEREADIFPSLKRAAQEARGRLRKNRKVDRLEWEHETLKLEYQLLDRKYEALKAENEALNAKNDSLRSKVSLLKWKARIYQDTDSEEDTTFVEDESPQPVRKELRDLSKAIEEFDMEVRRAQGVYDRNATDSR